MPNKKQRGKKNRSTTGKQSTENRGAKGMSDGRRNGNNRKMDDEQ